MKYEEIRPDLQTGDLVLFSARRGLLSRLIKLFTKSDVNHIGMVVRLDSGVDQVLIWHSTIKGGLKGLLGGNYVDGVQTDSLSRVIADYNGRVFIRQLKEPLGPELLATLGQVRRKLDGRPYERRPSQLIKAALDGLPFLRNANDLSSVFCSELITVVMHAWGWLTERITPSEMTPRDYKPGYNPQIDQHYRPVMPEIT